MRPWHEPVRPVVAVVGALLLIAGSLTLAGAAPVAPAALEITIGAGPGDALLFDPLVLTAPHDTTIRVTFANRSTESHNLTFQAPISAATRTIVESGATDAVIIRTPGPGAYSFVCTIHVDMSGTLEVT